MLLGISTPSALHVCSVYQGPIWCEIPTFQMLISLSLFDFMSIKFICYESVCSLLSFGGLHMCSGPSVYSIRGIKKHCCSTAAACKRATGRAVNMLTFFSRGIENSHAFRSMQNLRHVKENFLSFSAI